MNIFIAEDDPEDIRYIKKVVEKANILNLEVSYFINGKEIVEALEKDLAPDFLFLDMGLPYLDGFDVLKAIKKNTSKFQNLKVYVLSSSPLHEELLLEKGCKPTGFIQKPVDLNRLKEIVSV